MYGEGVKALPFSGIRILRNFCKLFTQLIMTIVLVRETKYFSFNDLENILIEFSASILAKSDEIEIAWDVSRNCISKLGFDDCVIYYVNDERTHLIQKAAYGPKNPKNYEIHQPLDIELGTGISGNVVLSGVGEIISDTSEDGRYIEDEDNRLSEIAIPIKIGATVIGVIDCEHHERDYFTSQHFKVLSAIASIVAIKINGLRNERENMEKEKQLIKAEKEMLALKAVALRSQMSPHFVFNSLNAIQHFVTTNDKVNTLKYFSIFSKLIRYYLMNFEVEEIGLQTEINMLDWYFKLQQLRYEDKFQFTIHTKELGDLDQVKIPSLILPILMERVVEAAISEDKLGKIDLYLSQQTNLVNIIIKHNISAELSSKWDDNAYVQWMEHIELFNRLKYNELGKPIRIKNTLSSSQSIIELTIPIIE